MYRYYFNYEKLIDDLSYHDDWGYDYAPTECCSVLPSAPREALGLIGLLCGMGIAPTEADRGRDRLYLGFREQRRVEKFLSYAFDGDDRNPDAAIRDDELSVEVGLVFRRGLVDVGHLVGFPMSSIPAVDQRIRARGAAEEAA